MTRGDTTPSHLNIFDWVCEPEPTPAGVIHPHPLLAPVTGSGRHDRGSERLEVAKRVTVIRKILERGTAVTWLYKAQRSHFREHNSSP